MIRRSDRARGGEAGAVSMALVAVALWSTVAVAFKKALEGLEPVDLVILSSFVSWLSLGVVMAVSRLRRGASPADRTGTPPAEAPGSSRRRSLAMALLLGLLNPVAYYLVLFAAYDRLPAQVAQPLNYTWPLFLALLAAPINRRYPSPRDLVAIVISFLGVVVISWRPASAGSSLDGLGVALALGSGVLWALYWLVGNRLAMNGTTRLFAGFSLAVAVLAAIWWTRGFPLPVTGSSWTAVLWVGLFEMGITFLFWNGALTRTVHPARIGNLVYLGPFVSLVWIRLFLGEEIRPATVGGLAVIVVGILFGQGVLGRRGKKLLNDRKDSDRS